MPLCQEESANWHTKHVTHVSLIESTAYSGADQCAGLRRFTGPHSRSHSLHIAAQDADVVDFRPFVLLQAGVAVLTSQTMHH